MAECVPVLPRVFTYERAHDSADFLNYLQVFSLLVSYFFFVSFLSRVSSNRCNHWTKEILIYRGRNASSCFFCSFAPIPRCFIYKIGWPHYVVISLGTRDTHITTKWNRSSLNHPFITVPRFFCSLFLHSKYNYKSHEYSSTMCIPLFAWTRQGVLSQSNKFHVKW